MPKRKRGNDRDYEDAGAGIEDQALRIKVTRLKAKVDQSTKALSSALKLARGFERQKLGRRQKNATEDPQTLLRLREEVIVLKQLQLEQTARNQLLKQLAKTKRIREHPAFEKVYGSDPVFAPLKSNAEGNVIGRLFKSGPVKQVMPEIMKTLHGLLGIDQAGPGSMGPSNTPASKPAKEAPEPESEDEFKGFSSDDAEDDNRPPTNGLEDGSDIDIDIDPDFAEYARGRLASSDEDSDNEAEERRRALLREDISLSPTPSEESPRVAEPPSKTSNPVQPVTKTAFLPSLSLGGYYSGSESGGEDDPNDYHGPALPQARKNRRGQRARQQLAELKYGKKAKHLEKQKNNPPPSRDDGWDQKRGAVDRGANHGRDRWRKGGAPAQQQQAPNDRSGPGFDQPSKPKKTVRDDQGSLHPSWEAAKKKKMQDKAQTSFQGKKITFD